MTAQSGGKLGPPVIDATCNRCNDNAKGTYRTKARCTNCGLDGEAVHSMGHNKIDSQNARCPRCDCRAVHMGDYLHDGDAVVLRDYGRGNASLSLEVRNGPAMLAKGYGLTTDELRDALLEEARRMGLQE